MDAADQIAYFIWNKGGYMAKCIRIWGNYFIKTGELLPYCQGKHTKLESLIDDEDFSENCIEWLRQQKPERGCIEIICIHGVLNMMREERVFSLTVMSDQMWWRIGTNGEKEYVQITHDECYSYATMGSDEFGFRKLYENPYIKDKETFVIRSVQVNGYWKAEHMLEQLVSKVIPVFEILHPRCIGVFCFDQSTNHNAMAEDALITKRMNLSSGGKQPVMRNGWFIDETEKKYVQLIVFPNNYQKEKLRGKQKGLRQVLEEQKLWPAEKVLLVCKKCSEKCTDNGPEKLDCCTHRIMSLQPDFLEQRSLLKEAVINAGHIFERYPKFHCECNFIEQYWGFMKQEARRLCNYNYKDLVNLVSEVLKSVPVTTIRKFSWLKGVAAE
ncbi:6645_t:CDS:2 [Cetraspora pellucida]|uniref:6645_t:CDS:1 n=1 Tax=Cetraspora pellucida TaxID=1433469 RepID=A0A9N9ENN7_9GLOM|nr:6645_t:CDS:2 [Cetraspora pellucida]